MIHLNDPYKALENMYSCLKPSGLLVLEEANASTSFCVPGEMYFEEWKTLWKTLHAFNQTRKNFERKLPDILKNYLGLQGVSVTFYQPVLDTYFTKKILWYDAKETFLAANAAGFYRDRNHQDFLNGLENLARDPKYQVHYVKKVQIMGRKCNA